MNQSLWVIVSGMKIAFKSFCDQQPSLFHRLSWFGSDRGSLCILNIFENKNKSWIQPDSARASRNVCNSTEHSRQKEYIYHYHLKSYRKNSQSKKKTNNFQFSLTLKLFWPTSSTLPSTSSAHSPGLPSLNNTHCQLFFSIYSQNMNIILNVLIFLLKSAANKLSGFQKPCYQLTVKYRHLVDQRSYDLSKTNFPKSST